MGLFDKKYCDICGEKIGLLGNRKLDDGNLCKECAKKLSPWFEERRHSTVDSIKEQLAYREANKAKVSAFQITREFATNRYHVYIDDTKGQFAIARAMNVDETLILWISPRSSAVSWMSGRTVRKSNTGIKMAIFRITFLRDINILMIIL